MLLADLQALLEKAPNYITNHASGIAADNTGNVFVSTLKGAIFKIDTKGEVTLFAGSVGVVGHMDGQGAVAKFSALGNMTTDAAGNLSLGHVRRHVPNLVLAHCQLAQQADRAYVDPFECQAAHLGSGVAQSFDELDNQDFGEFRIRT